MAAAATAFKPASASKEDSLDYDIGNLAAFDYCSLDKQLFSSKGENYLLEYSRDNCQLLMNQIFNCPTEEIKGEIGRLAVLPEPSTTIPREKPIPQAKALTKWEQFSRAKGIVKKKRGRMEFDEHSQEYAPRFGYKKANDFSQNVIIEHKEGDDPSIDPWTRLDQEKKSRVAKNKKQQSENELKAAGGSRLPGTIDLSTAMKQAPVKSTKKAMKKDSKHHVDVALTLAQKSTASLGKFDKKRQDEPVIKEKQPRRDAELARSIKAEKDQSMKVFSRLLGNDESSNFSGQKAANLHQQSEQKAKFKVKKPKTK